MTEWIQSVIACACIVTMLLHLVPEGKYLKYVKFYSGLLLMLVAIRPLLRFMGKEDQLARLIKLEVLKEEYYDMETSVEGMAELKNDAFGAAYRQEISRQVEEIALAWGAAAENIQILFDPEQEYQIRSISFSLKNPESLDGFVPGKIREEIAGLYMLVADRIILNE